MRKPPISTKWLAGLVAAVVVAGSPCAGQRRVLFEEDFESGESERWRERGFPSIRRRNRFAIATEPDGNRYLKVVSDDSTSGKGIRLSFDPQRCSTIRWRWRISNVIEDADLRRKEGDDAAAKVYVAFEGPSAWNPFDKRLLVYVWDNRLPVGTVLPNAWEPDMARMIVLESGADKADQWVEERVDLAEDYRRAFGAESAPEVQGIAFMPDSDNTGSTVTSGLDDLEVACPGEPDLPNE